MAVKFEDWELGSGSELLNFTISKQIGAGNYGNIYLAYDIKDHKKRVAVKAEPRMLCPFDETLEKEAFVINKLQHSKHVCKLLKFGKSEKYSYIVMTLLGRDLEELRRRMPDRKMSASSAIKVGIQVVQALRDVHEAGFVHRDVKPSNFATGVRQKNLIFILDFGVARQIHDKNGQDQKTLRDPRPFVMFRGAIRYSSLNVHAYKEPGRHDDLISVLYMLAECATSTLPWKGRPRKEAIAFKMTTPSDVIFKDCPPSFTSVYESLSNLQFKDEPAYKSIMMEFKADLDAMNVHLLDPFEWEKSRCKK